MNGQTVESRIRNPFKRWFVNSFLPVVPRRWKRLLYVSSILGLVSLWKNPDVRLLQKLNQVFSLATNVESYLLPVYFRNLIWKSSLGSVVHTNNGYVAMCQLDSTCLSEEDVDTLSCHLASNFPKSLVYGSQELLRLDAKRVIQEVIKFGSSPESYA